MMALNEAEDALAKLTVEERAVSSSTSSSSSSSSSSPSSSPLPSSSTSSLPSPLSPPPFAVSNRATRRTGATAEQNAELTESKKNYKQRIKQKRRDTSEAVLREIVLPPSMGHHSGLADMHTPIADVLASLASLTSAHGAAASAPAASVEALSSIDWDSMPSVLNSLSSPVDKSDMSGIRKAVRRPKPKDVAREARKRRQCEAFAACLRAASLPPGSTVADFGSGSCGLTLPLAYTFPGLEFVAVDINAKALEIMERRAEEAGLKNVRTVTGDIGAFSLPFDLAMALHACGQASDAAILQAVERGVPYLVAPCCIGKVGFSMGTTKTQMRTAFKMNKAAATAAATAAAGDGDLAAAAARLDTFQGETRAERLAAFRGEKAAAAAAVEEGGKAAEDAAALITNGNVGYAAFRAKNQGITFETLSYPRSEWLQSQLCLAVASEDERNLVFSNIASTADTSENAARFDKDNAMSTTGLFTQHEYTRMCSNLVCVDRNLFAEERNGFKSWTCSMPGLELEAKSDLLVGLKEGLLAI